MNSDISIVGSSTSFLAVLLSALVLWLQIKYNKEAWTDTFITRLVVSKKTQVKLAFVCGITLLVIWILQHRVPASSQYMVIAVRILAVAYLIFWGLLLNKILHASKWLATTQRLRMQKDSGRIDRQVILGREYSLLALPFWNIPRFASDKVTVEKNQKATFRAVRAIDICWLAILVVVVPTFELWLSQRQLGIVFGPFRIL